MGVCVYNENRPVGGIQQDAVCSFRTDALNGQQAFPQGLRGVKQHAVEISPILQFHHPHKISQPKGLDIEIAGRSDQIGKDFKGEGGKIGKGEKSGILQIGNGLFDICPAGVLGEDRARPEQTRYLMKERKMK